MCQSFGIDIHLQTGFETCTLFACRFQIGFKNQRVAGYREIGLYPKFGYWLGSGFKMASSLEILLFLHTIPKPLNRLVDPRNRSGQVIVVCNEEKKELMEPQLSPYLIASFKKIWI